MPYNSGLAFTNSQLRDQGMQSALENFMGYFKQLRAQKDDAEKESLMKEITAGGAPASTTGAAGGPQMGMDAAGMPTGIQNGPAGTANAKHLADIKAQYLMKYGQAPVTGADMLNQDLANEEKVAQIGDSKHKRARDLAQEGKVDAFGKTIEGDSTLTPSERAFYGAKPEAYGDRLKPASITYLPTDQGFVPMPTKVGPGGASATPAGPIQLPGGATPKPFSKDPAPVRWISKVDDEGKEYQENPVTGETRYTGKMAPKKPGQVTATPQDLADKAQQGIGLINQLIGEGDSGKTHPGFSDAVGAKGLSSGFGLLSKPISGTKAADFQALLDQVSGQAFLDARQQLKGGGAITDFEGKKAEGAITRMKTSQSEDEFIKAAKEYRNILQSASDRALAKARKSAAGSGATDENADPLGLGL